MVDLGCIQMTKEEMLELADKLENVELEPYVGVGSSKSDSTTVFMAAELIRAFAVLEPVGQLCVIPSNESTYGVEYDISTNKRGHERLSKMNGVLLYAAPVAEGEKS